MNILKNINKLLILISSSILGYITYLLLSNISKGFDITDESYYVLTATYPNKILSTLTHEGYYTGLLYTSANHNLSFFRLFGILLLLGISIWFSIELSKYLSKKFTLTLDIFDKLSLIIPISLGSLSYYKLWIITPSYNWLALISIILFFISLFRIITNQERNHNKYITIDYFLLGFTFSLAFMAKPTTALVLIIMAILFIIYEFRNLDLPKALLSVTLLTSIIVILHILLLDNGFSSYYDRLIESIERIALLGGGHTLNNQYTDMIELIQKFFFEEFYFHHIQNIYLYAILSILILLVIIHHKLNIFPIYLVLIFILFIIYPYFIYQNGLGKSFRLIWIRSIELLFFNLILTIIALLFMDKKIESLHRIVKIIPFIFIIILGSVAYKFGSNNQIIYTMSESMLFVITAILVVNILLDKISNIKIFTSLSGVILSIFIYYSINHAYQYPYRLITNIENQNQKVKLLGGLSVDKITKKYIEDLQKIANEHKEENEQLSIIDMTGGSPAVNIILDAKILGTPWLIGGYRGSNQFVESVLERYKGTKKLQNAWVLTAPKGKRQIDLSILHKVDLIFPQNYKKIGIVTTAHRNELQELWKPINTLE